MSVSEITVSGGPCREDLLRAAAACGKACPVVFLSSCERLEARIDAIDEESLGGLQFAVRGRLSSPNFAGAYFAGVYDARSRTGRLRLQGAI